MKIFIGAAGAILAVFVLGFFQKQQEYEFHTGNDGQVVWRCDRKTGEVKEFLSYRTNYELFEGRNQDFLLNKLTGQTWRYFQNGTNSNPDEGFCPLLHVNPVAIIDFQPSTNQF